MNTAERDIDLFVRLSDPYHLWSSLFGSLPGDTDICDGEDSAAAVALDSALIAMSEEMVSSSIGYPCELLVKSPGKKLIENVQKKVLAGAVLSSGTDRCERGSIPADIPSDRMGDFGKLAILGKFDSAPPILKSLIPDLPDNFFVSGTEDQKGSTIRLLPTDGKPTCRIRLRPEDQLQAFISQMLYNTVAHYLMDGREEDEPVQLIEDQVATLPINIRFLDEEETFRLEAITEFCGNYIDEHSCSLELALRRTSYRRTFLQRLIQRAQLYISEEMERYGFKSDEDGHLSSSFKKTRDVGTALYRLLGDEDFHLQGLLTREIISGVDLYLPEVDPEFPEIALVPENDIAISEYHKKHGPADATIALWSAADKIPSSADMEPVFEVVPYSTHSIQSALEKVSDIFGFEIIEEYETGE